MAFIGKLFGSLFGGGNTNEITTDIATSITTSVAAQTGTKCDADMRTKLVSGNMISTPPNCTNTIKVGTVDVEISQSLNMECIQSAAAKMESTNDISAQVSSALKSVQDGLAHTFDMLSSTEKNKITSTIKNAITTSFQNDSVLSCQQHIDTEVFTDNAMMGGCVTIELGDIKVKEQLTAATIRCIQNQSNALQSMNTVKDTLNSSLSKEITSPLAWLTDIAKQIAIVAAIAVVVGGIAMVMKGEDPESIAESIQNGAEETYEVGGRISGLTSGFESYRMTPMTTRPACSFRARRIANRS